MMRSQPQVVSGKLAAQGAIEANRQCRLPARGIPPLLGDAM